VGNKIQRADGRRTTESSLGRTAELGFNVAVDHRDQILKPNAVSLQSFGGLSLADFQLTLKVALNRL
jgi:hypothetical protein